MELIEKLQKIIEREIDNVPMVLTDPLTLRRLRAERLAQAALTALIEHAGQDGVTDADRDAANLAFNVWDNTNELALAFARHRATAFTAGKAARDREIVEWLRGQANIGDKKADDALNADNENAARAYLGAMQALNRAADAIERGGV